MRKIIIVNDYFSGWFVYNVFNWCEIEREREKDSAQEVRVR